MVRNYEPFRELDEYKLEFFGIENRKPKDYKWVAINSSRGGILKEPWLIVPDKIEKFNDILRALDRTEHIIVNKRLSRFNFTEDTLKPIKQKLFAYFLGILVGDASKLVNLRKFGPIRRVGLSLTKRHASNENLGEFVCLCANSLGLRMDRIKDTPKGKRNVYPFYRWTSQSSLLIQWIFNVCLGLKDDQTTTYDTINLDWILDAPKDFRLWFLQGLADSDGYVDIGVSQVGIISEPNSDLVEKILHSLNIHTSKKYLDCGTLGTIMINIQNAFKLPIFNPYVKSYRYTLVEKIAKANRIKRHWPKWLVNKIELYLKSDLSETQVILKILDEFNIFVHRKNLHKRRIKLQGGEYNKK